MITSGHGEVTVVIPEILIFQQSFVLVSKDGIFRRVSFYTQDSLPNNSGQKELRTYSRTCLEIERLAYERSCSENPTCFKVNVVLFLTQDGEADYIQVRIHQNFVHIEQRKAQDRIYRGRSKTIHFKQQGRGLRQPTKFQTKEGPTCRPSANVPES